MRDELEPLDHAPLDPYDMTEPQGVSDPRLFTTGAVRDGGDWE